MNTKLPLETMIVGEIHTSQKSIKRVVELTEMFKPDILLHELLYDDLCMTPDVIKERLRKCRMGSLCDPRLNKDIYELGHRLELPLVGIDLPRGGTFRERETHMVSKIESWYRRHRVLVVVGDTHLRDRPIPRVPHRSLIRDRFDNDPKVTISRVPQHLREVR